MVEKRKILVADSDRKTVQAIKNGFSDEFDVVAARDGSKALELSITEFPDLIMFYRHCPLIGAKQFLRILRTNPRTENIPLIILSDESLVGAALPGYLEGVLVKPLNLDEVRAHLNSVFQRADAAKEVRQERGAVQGSLAQISMVDLLQVFAMNRRSGRIRLTNEATSEVAEVYVADGKIEDAKVGLARGEKALYRLLSWEDGAFDFVPGAAAATATIAAPTDSLLMEGMRQSDELTRIRESTASPEAEVKRLVHPDEIPAGLHPVTAEILDLLQYYSRVSDLVDRAKATDLEVHLALQSLISNELIRVVEAVAEDGPAPLLNQDEVFDLLGRLRSAGVSPTFLHRPKVAFVSGSAEILLQVLGALSRLPEFEATGLERASHTKLHTLGSLHLSRGFSPEIIVVPPDERLLPLSFSLSAGAIAALVFGPVDDSGESVLRMLHSERRASVVRAVMGPKSEEALTGKTIAIASIDEDQVRQLLRDAFIDVDAAGLRDVAV